MAYNEVMAGTPLGNQLQALIEMQKFGTSQLDAEAIAKVRLDQKLNAMPQDRVLFATLSNKAFTAAQLRQEIQSGTMIGSQWVQGELSTMRTIMTLR